MDNQDVNLTAYCGLYCGDCIRYKSKVADLALEARRRAILNRRPARNRFNKIIFSYQQSNSSDSRKGGRVEDEDPGDHY